MIPLIRQAFFLGCIVANFTSLARADEYVVAWIEQTTAVKRLDQNQTGNLYPWEGPSCDQNTAIGECMISNSCGFAEADHIVTHSSAKHALHKIKLLHYLGEWCRIGGIPADTPKIVAYRRWHNLNYVVAEYQPIMDNRGNYYASAEDFEGSPGAPAFERFEADASECIEKAWILPDELEWYDSRADMLDKGSVYCPQLGVSLEALERWHTH